MKRIRSTTSWAERILQSQTFTPEQAWSVICPTRVALQRLLDAVGDADDLLYVAMSFNLAWARADAFEDQVRQVFELAGTALTEAERRGEEHGRVLFSGPERQYILEAIGMYDWLIRQSSPGQMARAAAEVRRRVNTELERRAA